MTRRTLLCTQITLQPTPSRDFGKSCLTNRTRLVDRESARPRLKKEDPKLSSLNVATLRIGAVRGMIKDLSKSLRKDPHMSHHQETIPDRILDIMMTEKDHSIRARPSQNSLIEIREIIFGHYIVRAVKICQITSTRNISQNLDIDTMPTKGKNKCMLIYMHIDKEEISRSLQIGI